MSRPQPAVIFIFVTLFLDVFGIGVIVPVLPKLVEQMSGGNLAAASHSVGWMGAIYALMQFSFAPVLGALSDRFGRRPVVLISLFGAGLDYLLMAWAPTLAWLFLGRGIAGLTAANFSAAGAYIADVTPPEKRAEGFGMIGAAFGLGFIAGPAIGGMLAELGPRVPFVASAVVTLLNAIYGVFVLPESLKPENRRPFHGQTAHPWRALRSLGRWPIVAGLAGTHFLIQVAHNIYPSLWVLYMGTRYGWTSRQVGLSLALVGLTAAVVQAGLAGRILAITGDRAGVFIGLCLMVVAMTCYGLASAGWMIPIVIVIGSMGAIGTPASQSIITQSVPPNEQGAVQGALSSLVSMAGIVGPVLWTRLFAASNGAERIVPWPGLPFFVAALLTAVGLGLAWPVLRRAPRSDA